MHHGESLKCRSWHCIYLTFDCADSYIFDHCTSIVRRLNLLNITVTQLAKSINTVLTLAYRDIYAEGPDDDVGQLQLLTSPLAANAEVLQLYTGGLIPVELAMPSVLHSIGASKDVIDRVVDEAMQKKKDEEASLKEKESLESEERKLAMDERKNNMDIANKQASQASATNPVAS